MTGSASSSNGRSAASGCRRPAAHRPTCSSGRREDTGRQTRPLAAAAAPAPPADHARDAPRRGVGGAGCARRRRLWRGRAEPAADRPGDPRRGGRSGARGECGARAGCRRYRSRGPRDHRRRDDHGRSGGPTRHADPRRQPEPGERAAGEPALGALGGDRAAPARDPLCPPRRTPPARGMAARRQAGADRSRGGGDPGQGSEPFCPAAERGRRRCREPRRRAPRHAGARARPCRPGDRRGPGRRAALEPADRQCDRRAAARGKPRRCVGAARRARTGEQRVAARYPDRRYAAARSAGAARRRCAAERGCAGEEARAPSGKST